MRNHLAHPTRRSFDVYQHVGAAMFPEQLATAPARGNRCSVADRAHGDESSATGAREFADHSAFRTERETIRCVFDIATRDDATVVCQASGTDAKVRIGNIGERCGFMCGSAQGGPVDVRHERNASQRRQPRGLARDVAVLTAVLRACVLADVRRNNLRAGMVRAPKKCAERLSSKVALGTPCLSQEHN